MEKSVKLILGTMTFGEQIFDEAAEMIKCHMEHGNEEIDTAYVYNDGQSEKIIGEALKKLSYPKIKIATKINPRITGRLDGEAVYMQFNESLQRMGVSRVDILYLHFPDKSTPIESALMACNDLYQQGKISELGLSNFPAWLVVEVFYKCKINGWILPTVYEGLYNPLSRKAEIELDQALSACGIRFYAYNPLAGGMLTNKYSDIEDTLIEGRFTFRPNYRNRYWTQAYFQAVDIVKEECKKYEIDIVEATYRWMMYHSMLSEERGDGIIVGVSKKEQLQTNLEVAKKGELVGNIAEAFDMAWEISKKDAPEYFRYYNSGI